MILSSFEVSCGHIINRVFYPAAYINTYTIRYDLIFNGQHTTDGQSITQVCIGHQSPTNRNGQFESLIHLVSGRWFNIYSTNICKWSCHFFWQNDLPFRFFLRHQHFCQFRPHRIHQKCFWICLYLRQLFNDGLHLHFFAVSGNQTHNQGNLFSFIETQRQ